MIGGIVMSLLFPVLDPKMSDVAREVYQRQFVIDPKLDQEYDERQKKLMYDDILMNIGYINTALELDDEKIFVEYSVWIYRLLCSLMKNLDKDRIKEHMIKHFEILNESLSKILSAEDASKADRFIKLAIEATEFESRRENPFFETFSDKYIDIKRQYLAKLLQTDTRGAVKVIEDAVKSGIELEDIYIKILQEVMFEVGEMWHKNLISVDKEHYCTSTTQIALSQFYPVIFSKERKGYTFVACSVGSELHEMGIRMVSDLLEFNGWESIYLGAGVPINAVLSAIKENKPNLIGLSVTMPQHLGLCLEYVQAIRTQFPDVKIAIGGRAFETTNRIWEKWDVDVYTKNASSLITWVRENIEKNRKN